MRIQSVEKILRVAIFLTFLGHGMVAIQGHLPWIDYLEFIGFSSDRASDILPFIGFLDILVALTILIKPYKYMVLWASIWAFSAALIRPLSGEEIWAFVERGSNWMTPLALYICLMIKSKNQNCD